MSTMQIKRRRGTVPLCTLLAALGAHATAQQQEGDIGRGVVEASAPARRRAPHPLDPATCGIGARVAPLPWRDLRGRRGQLGRIGARKGQVVVLTDTTCPLTQRYAPRLSRLVAECAKWELELLLLNPSEGEAAEQLSSWLEQHEIDATYVHDPSGDLARELGAQTTTDCFLLDDQGRRVYRGALDDQYGIGYALEHPRETYLADAVAALLAGETPDVAATWAPGCVLGLAPRAGLEPSTWHGRISRIVRARCGDCHRTGGVAPFPLETLGQVRRQRAMLAYVLEEEIMPPWTARGGGPWANDGSIPEDERAALLDWLADGTPEGDEATALAPLPAPPDAWQIGTPDVVFELPREVEVQAEGVMDYVHLLVDSPFEEDRWVQAMEIRPTDPAVVHHVVVHVTEGGSEGRRQRRRIDASTGFFAGYVPGNGYNVLPPGFARRLPAGAQLLFELHYTPQGRATLDRSRLGLVFASEPPRHEVKSFGIAQTRLDIPPGAAHHEVVRSVELPRSIAVLALMPHMHLRGDSVRIDARRPDETTLELLSVPAYDFNWQFSYRFLEPVPLDAGSSIRVRAWFDNSAGNPANPDPGRRVTWGNQTTDEMMIGYVEYYEL